MYNKILNYISKHKKTNIITWNMQRYFQVNEDFDYKEFANSINKLIEDKIIEPVSASGLNHRKDYPLYEKYRKTKTREVVSEQDKKEILNMYHVKMKVVNYITNPQEYTQDRPFLQAINQFLCSDTDDWVTVNERSFELVHDEKWLFSNGMAFLKKIGLTLKDLKCTKIYEPFFYYVLPSWKSSLSCNVLIVENKDTYGSFKSLFMEGFNAFSGITFDMLIYGEGEKIISSIESIWEIEGAKTKEIKGYYFGDIDPVGIQICLSLMKQNEIQVRPMSLFYDELITRYKSLRLERKNVQKYNPKMSNEFSTYIYPGLVDDFLEVIKDHYLPQEGLNKTILKAVSEGE